MSTPLPSLRDSSYPYLSDETETYLEMDQESVKFRQSSGYTSTYKSVPTLTEAHSAAFSLHGKNKADIHKLVQESRKFVLTYLLLQISFLFAFTALHWGGRIQRWRKSQKKRVRLNCNSELATGGAEVIFNHYGRRDGLAARDLPPSTGGIGGTPRCLMTPNFEPEERIPLLSGAEIDISRIPPRKLLIMRRQLKAWLVYQPKPIPFFNKTLPPNGTSVTILVLIGIEIFYSFYNMHHSLPTIVVFADRMSLLFAANLPLLYLLAAKNQPIKLLTGYSYEALNIFHRRLGEIMVLLGLIHAAGMFVEWYTILRSIGFNIMKYLSSKIIIWGICVLIACVIVRHIPRKFSPAAL